MFSAVLRHPICVSMIAPLPPSERVIKRPIETYEISREKKKIYLIVRISCTLIQPIHSVIWYETPHQNFHRYYNSRSKRHSNLLDFLFLSFDARLSITLFLQLSIRPRHYADWLSVFLVSAKNNQRETSST